MKKILFIGSLIAGLFVATGAYAGGTVTLTGKVTCPNCDNNVKKGGDLYIEVLTPDNTFKKFQLQIPNVDPGTYHNKKLKVTGTVSKKDGKPVIHATSVKEAESD